MPITKDSSLCQLSALLNVYLHEYGFRHKYFTHFIKWERGGLAHIISIFLEYDVPVALRNNLKHPKFTIYVGVFVPEVAKFLGFPQPSCRTVPHSTSWVIKTNLGFLSPAKSEIFWPMSFAVTDLEQIKEYLTQYALPFLESLSTRTQVQAYLYTRPSSSFPSLGHRVMSAIMLARRGRKLPAAQLLQEELDSPSSRLAPTYVYNLAQRLSLIQPCAQEN